MTWVAITPWAEMDRVDRPVIHRDRGLAGGVDEASLRRTIRDAHARGLKVMVKPFIHVDPAGGQWRGTIAMTSEEDWRAWFAAYRALLLDSARIAREEKADLLCVGLEYLASTTTPRQSEWRRLIAETRRAYPGPLTYAANWWGEFDQIQFWDALDFIGINFFFPVASGPSPTVEEMRGAMEPIAERIAAVSRRFGKPVLFTEVGYRSSRGAGIRPWEWTPSEEPSDPGLQARAYRALLDTFGDRPWMAGIYWYEWFTDLEPSLAPNPWFTPAGKPAEDVLRDYLRQRQPRPPAARRP